MRRFIIESQSSNTEKTFYTSMLMLEEHPPDKFCPAMNPTTIALFIIFKRSKKGEPLLDQHGNPVKDVFGEEIKCQGGWNNPKNAEQYLAAIGCIHAARIGRQVLTNPVMNVV